METPLPEFGLTHDEGYDGRVDSWLAARGLRYQQVMYNKDIKPLGYHTVEGISPRGGMHACVGLDGEIVWDPHPEDGTEHGLRTVERYGLLLPLAEATAKDADLPINESRFNKEYRKRIGYTKLVPIDAAEFKRSWEGRHNGERLDWNSGRSQRLLDLPHVDDYPKVYKAPDGTYDVLDGRHRIAEAARRGGTITVAMPRRTKDSVTLEPDKDGDNMLRYTAKDSWGSERLKSLRAHYNFEKRTWPNRAPEVPKDCELVKGVLQWKAGMEPRIHSVEHDLPPRRAKDELHHIQISTKDGSVHPDPKFKRQYAQWARDRMHRALDRALDHAVTK